MARWLRMAWAQRFTPIRRLLDLFDRGLADLTDTELLELRQSLRPSPLCKSMGRAIERALPRRQQIRSWSACPGRSVALDGNEPVCEKTWRTSLEESGAEDIFQLLLIAVFR